MPRADTEYVKRTIQTNANMSNEELVKHMEGWTQEDIQQVRDNLGNKSYDWSQHDQVVAQNSPRTTAQPTTTATPSTAANPNTATTPAPAPGPSPAPTPPSPSSPAPAQPNPVPDQPDTPAEIAARKQQDINNTKP